VSAEPIRISVPALALISSVGAFGTHLLLPALPAIRDEFAVSSAQVQLVVSLSLLALALGALVNGPLSDRYGRRPVALAGLVLYIGGSALAWLGGDLVEVLVGRVVQAMGGGAAITVVRAMIRDLYDRDAAASIFGYMASFVLLVPLLVPLLGGAISEHFGWRSNFLAAIAVGVVVWLFIWLRLPETRNFNAIGGEGLGENIGSVLRNRVFIGYALCYSCSMAGLQALVAGAPLLLVGSGGLSATAYGAWYMLAAAASLCGFILAGRYSRRAGIRRMIQTGLAVSILATTTLLIVQGAFGAFAPLAFMLPAMGHSFANALMSPSATSGAIGEHPELAGSAAGVMGFMQFLFAAAAAQLTGVLHDVTQMGVAIVMAGASLGALAAYVLLVRGHAPVQALPRQAK
jgi:DHA1 family bicyclomycin/chloramphenicol resistance-like MFS transporter